MSVNRQTYKDVLLERRQHVALKTAGGWIFGKVLDYTDTITYLLMDSMDPGTTQSSITHGSDTVSAEWLAWVRNSDGKKIFYHEDSSKLLHAFIGIGHPHTILFTQYPVGRTMGDTANLSSTGIPSDTAGVVGSQSPMLAPSPLTELMIPSKLMINHKIYQGNFNTIRPVFAMPMREYDVTWYRPDKTVDHDIIDKIISGAARCHWWSPGNGEINYSPTTNIDTHLVPIDVTEWR